LKNTIFSFSSGRKKQLFVAQCQKNARCLEALEVFDPLWTLFLNQSRLPEAVELFQLHAK